MNRQDLDCLIDEELALRSPLRLNALTLDASTAKTSADLAQYLRETVPAFVYRHLVKAGSVKQCGGISEAFATAARDAGFDTYVSSRPGHFYNVVRVQDGVFEVDLSAIQFEYRYDPEDPHGDEGMERLLVTVAEDPFRAIKVRRIDEVPYWARSPSPEDEAMCYVPVDTLRRDMKRVERAMRGEYASHDRARHVLEGRPYASKMKVTLGDLDTDHEMR